MTTQSDFHIQADDCYRCGYLLHGIANDQACPECGLLAERSRHLTDELHETRPKWLRSLFFGVVLILASILLAIAWTVIFPSIMEALSWRRGWVSGARTCESGFTIIAGIFFLGVVLLTRPERYEPADRADWRLRLVLRLAALVPFFVIAFPIIQTEIINYRVGRNMWFYERDELKWMDTAAIFTATLGAIPLPLLLFLRLRGLAKRARSAHLAEHCLIVGIGASLSLLYGFGLYEVMDHAEQWGFGANWTTNSTTSLIIALIMGVAAFLFTLWSLYLVIRFALAFRKASRHLSLKWRRDDRALQDFESLI
jgi:MFS family permease